jgi:glycosyltransferase involved in cell wall biosynthesis
VTERVRILRVITRLNIGGPALHATLLTERLDPHRYDSLLVAGTEDPGEGNYLALRGRNLERLVVVPALGRGIHGRHDVAAFTQLVRLMRRTRPHIVHTHTAKAGTLGRLAAWVAGVPMVVHTYHGHVLRGYFPPAKTRVFAAIERVLARRTDRLLAVSETVRTDLLDMGIGCPQRFVLMPLGLDLEPYIGCVSSRGALRTELGLAGDTPLVGIVARLVHIKAHEVFLEAAARVVRVLPGCGFLIVGDGERRAELHDRVVALGLDRQVRFLGWRRDLERIYADLDLVALTSRNEGLPVSLIEAMAAGCAVVATRVGGVPDLVEDGVTGVLVPSGHPVALAEAMTALLRDPVRRQAFGQAGQKRVAPMFGADRLLRDMARLYSELLEERGARAER